MDEENKKIFVIFGENTLINKGISNVLKLKIKQKHFHKNQENTDDYIIVDLHKNIDGIQIKDYINAINKIFNDVIFISLYIDANLIQSQQIIIDIKNELKIKNLYYITEILKILQNNPQN